MLRGLPNLRLPEPLASGTRRSYDRDRTTQRLTGAVSSPYNGHRPHRALDLEPPDTTAPLAATRGDPPAALTSLRRHDLLGGLIHEYQLAA